MLKSFAGAAVQTTLAGPMTALATAFDIANTDGWTFSRRFVVVIDRGELSEEKILCSSISGSTVTVEQRGYDGTVAMAHASGAPVMHALDAETMRGLNNNSWHLIESKSPAAVAAGTVGNFFFDNIPTEYQRLRITVPWMSHSSTSSAHLYFRFNQSAAGYGTHYLYHTSGGLSGSYTNNGGMAYAIYSYFYGGSSRRTFMELDIWSMPGQRPGYDCRAFTPSSDTGYPYGSWCKGTWDSTADITRIDLYTSISTNWDPLSVFNLYGMSEENI